MLLEEWLPCGFCTALYDLQVSEEADAMHGADNEKVNGIRRRISVGSMTSFWQTLEVDSENYPG